MAPRARDGCVRRRPADHGIGALASRIVHRSGRRAFVFVPRYACSGRTAPRGRRTLPPRCGGSACGTPAEYAAAYGGAAESETCLVQDASIGSCRFEGTGPRSPAFGAFAATVPVRRGRSAAGVGRGPPAHSAPTGGGRRGPRGRRDVRRISPCAIRAPRALPGRLPARYSEERGHVQRGFLHRHLRGQGGARHRLRSHAHHGSAAGRRLSRRQHEGPDHAAARDSRRIRRGVRRRRSGRRRRDGEREDLRGQHQPALLHPPGAVRRVGPVCGRTTHRQPAVGHSADRDLRGRDRRPGPGLRLVGPRRGYAHLGDRRPHYGLQVPGGWRRRDVLGMAVRRR